MGNLTVEFEDALMDLIDEYVEKGLSSDDIMAVLQLRAYAVNEEED